MVSAPAPPARSKNMWSRLAPEKQDGDLELILDNKSVVKRSHWTFSCRCSQSDEDQRWRTSESTHRRVHQLFPQLFIFLFATSTKHGVRIRWIQAPLLLNHSITHTHTHTHTHTQWAYISFSVSLGRCPTGSLHLHPRQWEPGSLGENCVCVCVCFYVCVFLCVCVCV